MLFRLVLRHDHHTLTYVRWLHRIFMRASMYMYNCSVCSFEYSMHIASITGYTCTTCSTLPIYLSLFLSQSDPNLRPVNVLECRNILPPTPIVPPSAILPANLSRFNPSHKVFCCTMNAVPATSGVLSKLKLPFAIHIHPYKDMPHNVSNSHAHTCIHVNCMFFSSHG